MAIKDNTRFRQLFDAVCGKVADLRERLRAKDAVIGSFVEDS